MGSNVFPLSFNSHIIFCIIAVVFFLIQYIRLRYTYQLLTIIAVAGTLLLYVNSSSTFFYAIGIFELIMLILIGVFIAKQRKQQNAQEKKNLEKNAADAPNE